MCDLKVNLAEAEEDVLIMAERLSSLYYHMVKNIIEYMGEDKAEELVNKIIYEYGIDCGNKTRKKVESLGKENTIENYYLGKDLPTLGWKKTKLKLEDSNSVASNISYCPLAHSWKELDFEKWGRIYCNVDQAKYEGYNSCLKCTHDKNMLDGDDCCIVRVTKVVKD